MIARMSNPTIATLVPGAGAHAGTREVRAPFDGALLGSVELASAATVETAG